MPTQPSNIPQNPREPQNPQEQAQKLAQLVTLMNELGLGGFPQAPGMQQAGMPMPPMFQQEEQYSMEELDEFDPYDDFFEASTARTSERKERKPRDMVHPYDEVTVESILRENGVELSAPMLDARPLLTIQPNYADTPEQSLMDYIDRLEHYPRLSLDGFIRYATDEDDEYRFFLQEAQKLSEAGEFAQLEELIFDYHYDGQRELYEKRGVLFASQVSYYTLWEQLDGGEGVTLYVCDADIANVTLRLCVYERDGKWGYYVSDLALGEYTYIAEPGFVMTRGGLAWMFLVSFVCNYIHNPWIVSMVNDSLLFMTKEDYFRANGIEWHPQNQESAFPTDGAKNVADFISTQGVIAKTFDENTREKMQGYQKMEPYSGQSRMAQNRTSASASVREARKQAASGPAQNVQQRQQVHAGQPSQFVQESAPSQGMPQQVSGARASQPMPRASQAMPRASQPMPRASQAMPNSDSANVGLSSSPMEANEKANAQLKREKEKRAAQASQQFPSHTSMSMPQATFSSPSTAMPSGSPSVAVPTQQDAESDASTPSLVEMLAAAAGQAQQGKDEPLVKVPERPIRARRNVKPAKNRPPRNTGIPRR